MAMKALFLGVPHEQVAALYEVSARTLSRWVKQFNDQGIDGLIEKTGRGRPAKISLEAGSAYRELLRHPGMADETHWTGKKFHGYLSKKFDLEIGYRTVMRWIHEQGFRLKVPRKWPNGQDKEKRKAFIEEIRAYLLDHGIDLWWLDESGIEGDPRPRRRFAQRGEKIYHPYQGAHIRMNVTGTVCPRTGEFHALMFSHSDSQIFQIYLDHANRDIEFERPRNLLIMDNASWHKNKSIDWGRFEPVYLPPYSPDLNPIERLWLVMKQEWFSDFTAKSRDELIERLIKALNWVTDRSEDNKKTCTIPTKL